MRGFDSTQWLPDAAAIASLLDVASGDPVPRFIERALVAPAVDLTRRPCKRLRAELVSLSARLAHESEPDAGKVAACAAAVELLHAGSLIVDDVQDGSAVRRGAPAVHLAHGVPQALCTGNWLYFWPLRLIRGAGFSPEREHLACALYQEAVEKAHYGQALDLSVRPEALTQADVVKLAGAVLDLKTGAVTALAMSLGALVGGASPSDIAPIAAFGRRFGVTLQLLDDFGNLIGRSDPDKRREDLRQRKLSGVWLQVARQSSAADYAVFCAALSCFDQGDERPVDEFVASRRLLDTAVAEVRLELQAGFADLAAARGLSEDASIMRELKCLSEGLIHAYF